MYKFIYERMNECEMFLPSLLFNYLIAFGTLLHSPYNTWGFFGLKCSSNLKDHDVRGRAGYLSSSSKVKIS